MGNSRSQISALYFFAGLNEVIIIDSSSAINPATGPSGRSGGHRNTDGGLARSAEVSFSADTGMQFEC